MCPRAVLALLLLGLGCGGSPSGAQDAAATDGPDIDDAEPADAAQEDAFKTVPAWLARTFRIRQVWDHTWALGDTMAQLMHDEATASPRPDRRVLVFRLWDAPDGGAWITVGIAQGTGDGGEPPYRFVEEPSPAEVVTGHYFRDGGLEDYWSGFSDTFVVAVAIPPHEGHPTQLLRLTANNVEAAYTPADGVWQGGHVFSVISAEDACQIWIRDANLLDELDGLPTGPADGGSVDYATCTPHSYEPPPYSLTVYVDDADRVDLQVRE